jgi:hypothetical protein
MFNNRHTIAHWLLALALLGLLLTGCGRRETEAPAAEPGNAAVQAEPTADAGATGGGDVPISAPAGPSNSQTGAGFVRGTVTDAAGTPLAGVLVIPESLDTPPRAVPEIAVMTDDQGRYEWGLDAGRYRLTFTMDGYTQAQHEVVVQGQPTVLDLQLASQ